ncbi:hypothetical protein [Engelhardtia mirabilis]|uniref:Uncharacterized protein n=1 Tax=Engelhardtia mirabilis TaxID=2528011 RepID=A0A518BL14_9BACT|nr:hypothetical protein Pla133_27530 [Planctomycetes bacterium Pla133]QDV01991.1 hypothetical protein Pla86_27520 [Planctomycetes bacterium Pla86]
MSSSIETSGPQLLTEPPEDFLERLADMTWNHEKERDGISIDEIHAFDAINHVVSGTVEIDGLEYGFQIESGDIHGTLVHAWGAAEDVGRYVPPEPEQRTFIPRDRELPTRRPEMFAVYLAWRDTPWFKEKVGGLNYDSHFAPGGKTESYYSDWAAQRGMTVGGMSDFRAMLAEYKAGQAMEGGSK